MGSAAAAAAQSAAHADPFERSRREQARWLCLCQMDAARPDWITDLALLACIQAVHADINLRELRREVDYLSLRGLANIENREGLWRLKLTYQGVDVVEYTAACPDGISRPLR